MCRKRCICNVRIDVWDVWLYGMDGCMDYGYIIDAGSGDTMIQYEGWNIQMHECTHAYNKVEHWLAVMHCSNALQ